MKELFIKFIKTVFFTVIGCFILCKSYMYMHTHDNVSFLIEAALIILVFISIIFLKVNYLKNTDKEIAAAAISLFLYAVQRKQGKIEEIERAEYLLKDHPIGEVVKELVDNIEINESKEKE